MSAIPEIRIVKCEFGNLSSAPSLNPKLSPDSPLLIVTLDVCWDEPQPIEALGRVEDGLKRIWPSFGRHECRGDAAYQVFVERGGGDPACAAERSGGDSPPDKVRFDGALALAHLIEHATIDFLCTITRATTCSGFTGAYHNPRGRFDVIVDCPDHRAGRCALVLALSWITAALEGRPPRAPEHDVLEVARMACGEARRSLTPPSVARALDWDEPRAMRALAVLKDAGYLDESRYALNFSGVTEYRASGS